jgi:rubrerythrin
VNPVKINTPQVCWWMTGHEYVCVVCGGIFAFYSPIGNEPKECPICGYDSEKEKAHENRIRS